MTARQPSLPLPGLASTGRAKGALRQATGASAERVVERAHQACVAAGLASPLLRLDAGVRVGPGGRAVIRAQGSVDYVAVLKDGRALVLEVKALDGDRWRLSTLADHQRQALAHAEAMGALALVVIVQAQHLVVMAWWQLSLALAHGHASIDPGTLAHWRVRPGTHYLSRHLETRP